MRPELEKYYLIDRYLRGELSEEELSDFNKKVSEKPEFAEEVEYQKNINELVTVNYYHNLREQIANDVNKIDKKREINRKWFKRTFILTTLALISGYLLTFKGEFSDKRITENKKTDIKLKENQLLPDTQLKSAKVLAEKPTSSGNLSDQVKDTPAQEPNEPETKPRTIDTSETKPERSAIIAEQKSDKTITTASDTAGKIIVDIDTISPGTKRKEPAPLPSEQSEEPEENTKKALTPCNESSIEALWKIEDACSGQNNGEILLDKLTISGGTSPYQVSLLNSGTAYTGTGFKNLYSGSYTLQITDSEGCVKNWEISVNNKPCQPKHVSISPGYGESWKYYGKENKTYYLSIFNQGGRLVYKSSLTNGEIEWAGNSETGSLLESGIYIYIIEYSNGEKESGQITILR